MLKFEFEIDQVNLILAALSKAPYEQVYSLVDAIRLQAEPQLKALQEAHKE